VVGCLLLDIFLHDSSEAIGDMLVLLAKVQEFVLGLAEILLVMSIVTLPSFIHNDSIIIVRVENLQEARAHRLRNNVFCSKYCWWVGNAPTISFWKL